MSNPTHAGEAAGQWSRGRQLASENWKRWPWPWTSCVTSAKSPPLLNLRLFTWRILKKQTPSAQV